MTSNSAFAPGIYENLTNEQYHAAPGVSNSTLKTFLVSPLHCWHATLNPELECALCGVSRGKHANLPCQFFSARAETPALRLGSALHTATLEPEKFMERYAPRPAAADYTEALTTVQSMQEWLIAQGLPFKKSAAKPELQAVCREAKAPLLEDMLSAQAKKDYGKKYLDKAEWAQACRMAAALERESALKPYLADGVGEVSIFALDPDTGLLLKCRVDWMAARSRVIVDPKTFSTRGRTVDAAVASAIQFDYHTQPWFYLHVLRLATEAGYADLSGFSWLYAFVESDAPYEVRLRSMGPDGSKYWDATGAEIQGALRRFAEYQREFGNKPWAYHQQVRPVTDTEMKAVIYREVEEWV